MTKKLFQTIRYLFLVLLIFFLFVLLPIIVVGHFFSVCAFGCDNIDPFLTGVKSLFTWPFVVKPENFIQATILIFIALLIYSVEIAGVWIIFRILKRIHNKFLRIMVLVLLLSIVGCIVYTELQPSRTPLIFDQK